MNPAILVAGDAGPDYNAYLHFDGPNPPPNCKATRVRRSTGGAALAYRILTEWAGPDRTGSIAFAAPPVAAPPVFAVWKPQLLGKAFKPGDEKAQVWRVQRSTGPGAIIDEVPLTPPDFPPPPPAGFSPDVLLLVDNAAGYRHPRGVVLPHEEAWGRPETRIVWQMAAPLCRGELWWRAVKAGVLDRVAIVVGLDQFRLEPTRVSRRISWERTALEVARELEGNPALAALRSVAHVIVTIHGEGAVWRRRTANHGEYTLVFDAENMEGEWWLRHGTRGAAYGYGSTFAAALAAGLAGDPGPSLAGAISRGLLARRTLHAWGHGPVDDHAAPDFPAKYLANVVRDGANALPPLEKRAFGSFSAVMLPLEEVILPDSRWRIARSGSGRPAREPLYGLARRVAVYGERELRGIPHARFGDLVTADRDEIEALRNLRMLVEDYRNGTETKPLSLAVFGPPGAGKSFAVKQIAKEVLGESREVLEFNLSQFDEEDLAGAFHQVRDKVLEGKMPVVFWDEFDSSEYKWLRLLLAPMNDGKFQEGQITHPLGRCIFVFAGGTSYTMEGFGPQEMDGEPSPSASDSAAMRDCPSDKEAREAWHEFKLLKGPDFKSRVHGFLNILGPNRCQMADRSCAQGTKDQADETDVCFPLRRAIMLRGILGLKAGQRLEIDTGLLSALLETTKYTNGSRSFEKILLAMKGRKTDERYRPSDLPSDAVLAMNVEDPAEFKRLLVRDDAFKTNAALLGKAFHDVWRAGKREKLGDAPFNFDCGFDDLPESKKNDNLGAAMRMPRNLLMGGLVLVPAEAAGDDAVAAIPEEMVDAMAEEEHHQWMESALAEGFRQKRKDEERDDTRLVHDCILSWDDLPDSQREYDRWFIRKYPEFARSAGYAVAARGRG